ncbi:MAG TPA: HD domain-containing protein [Candidatus Saccharimonadia bacterium]|nr:HD domain-containing protein [Candidatus Saccharimonadia bacterium]
MNREALLSKLEQYLESDADFRIVYKYVEKRFKDTPNLVAHNWDHARRDTLNAIVIGESEDADMSIVLPAMIMHDIGFLYGASGPTHGTIGAQKLKEFLKDAGISLSQDKITRIANCIRTHKGSLHNETPTTLEAKVISDADLLDKFGPIGVYQGIRVFVEFNYDIDKIIESLVGRHKKAVFQTPTGAALARGQEDYPANFGRALQQAYEPYREDLS